MLLRRQTVCFLRLTTPCLINALCLEATIPSSTSVSYTSVRSADHSHLAQKECSPGTFHHVGYRLWPARKAVYNFVGLGRQLSR